MIQPSISPVETVRINSTLIEWTVFDPAVKTNLTSHAIAIDGKVVLIDPTLPDRDTLNSITHMGIPCGIFLTNGNHERASKALSKELNIPVAAPALAIREFSFKPDIILDGLKQIYGFHPVLLPGAAIGEHALYCQKTETLCVGDALINLPGTGLSILPDKYCQNAAVLKQSLLSLLSLKIDILIFAHGKALARPGPELRKLIGSV